MVQVIVKLRSINGFLSDCGSITQENLLYL